MWPQPSEPIVNNVHAFEILNLAWNSLRRTVAPQKPGLEPAVKLGYYGKSPTSGNILKMIWMKTRLEISKLVFISWKFLALEASKHKSSKTCSEHHLWDSRLHSLMQNQTPENLVGVSIRKATDLGYLLKKGPNEAHASRQPNFVTAYLGDFWVIWKPEGHA